MTDEKYELVDREYDHVPRINPSRQIRTKSSSFGSIYDRFTQFRIRRLTAKLEKKKEQVLTKGYPLKNLEGKVGRDAGIIANLESKIMTLSKENVPGSYVARRAIKLRKAMIANLTWHSGQLYSIGKDHYEDVFESEAVEELPEEVAPIEEKAPVMEPVEPALAAAIPSDTSQKIDVVPNDLEREAIVDVVNSSFEEKAKEEAPAEASDEPKIIDSSDVREVINDQLDQVDHVEKVDHTETVVPPVIDKADVQAAVDEAFQRMEQEGKEAEKAAPVIPSDDPIERAMERVRVSKNSVKEVNPTYFDINGRRIERHKYDYTPMTDEEVRQSQIKLGFDEHGNLIDDHKVRKPGVSSARVVGNFVAPGAPTLNDILIPSEKKIEDVPMREIPVVAPERKAPTEEFDLDSGENMFEVIEPSTEDPKKEEVEEVFTPAPPTVDADGKTVEDYAALKEKILLLQRQQAITQKNREEAQKRAQEAAERAKAAERTYELSRENYNARMEKLRAYTARLESACEENVRLAREANKDARMSEAYEQQQRSLVEKNNRVIEEIDSMMGDSGPETTAVMPRR